VALARICGLNRVDALITDRGASEEALAVMRDGGVDVTLV
jgi:DeoR/GlpR family transcriptional regulator of sugar metabolism